jgi:hypothetical protein
MNTGWLFETSCKKAASNKNKLQLKNIQLQGYRLICTIGGTTHLSHV